MGEMAEDPRRLDGRRPPPPIGSPTEVKSSQQPRRSIETSLGITAAAARRMRTVREALDVCLIAV